MGPSQVDGTHDKSLGQAANAIDVLGELDEVTRSSYSH